MLSVSTDRQPARIETATRADQDQTIALWRQAGLTRPWNDPATDFLRALETPTSDMFVIRQGDAVIASVMVGFEGHRGWVYYLATAESCRGQGYARLLMHHCEQWLLARNCPKLMLMVRSANTGVIAFYEDLGYERSDVVTMQKWIDGTSPTSAAPDEPK